MNVDSHLHLSRVCYLSVALAVFSAGAQASISVSLSTSVASPQPIGANIQILATAIDSAPGPVSYKFEIQSPGSSSFAMLCDFSLSSTFNWVPSTFTDGTYTLRVTARDYLAGFTSTPATAPFTLKSLITNSGVPVVTATSNPLVALFSAPPCASGSSIRVKFKGVSLQASYYTNFLPCPATSTNILIAGMRPSTAYSMNFEIETGTTITDDPHVLQFTTGAIPAGVTLPAPTFLVPDSASTSTAEKVNLISPGELGLGMFSTDLSGNYTWYFQDSAIDQFTRPVTGGNFLIFEQGTGTGTGYFGASNLRQQTLRRVDLLGNTILETNAPRVSEQLPISDLPYGIDRFSHEARALPNGDYLVLGETQTIVPAGVQGTAAIDVIGGVILILDSNFQVLWYWNSFDHDGGGTQLDISRTAILREQCVAGSGGANDPNGPGCPDVLLSSPANDWLHANALQLLSDGSILMSLRNQDWVIKVDYGNGTGTGNVLWRMGRQGDFTFSGSSDPWPWFSGQHDPEFQNNALAEMTVFDDGNTRIIYERSGDSRGQVLSVSEASMTVSFILDTDLGARSFLLGSAQPLSNGDYSFDNGDVHGVTSQSVEVNTSGVQTFNEDLPIPAYRSFRMTDFYNVPQT
jgi:arylsulfate sulfotransferase